jgi:hypothetical protein
MQRKRIALAPPDLDDDSKRPKTEPTVPVVVSGNTTSGF